MTRCAAACGRDLPDEELIETGGVLVCGPCHESIAKQAERRDSIDDALRALRSVAGDGALLINLDIAPRGPIGIGLIYYRPGTRGPAAEIATTGGMATVAKTMREMATVIDNLPEPLPAGAT